MPFYPLTEILIIPLGIPEADRERFQRGTLNLKFWKVGEVRELQYLEFSQDVRAVLNQPT